MIVVAAITMTASVYGIVSLIVFVVVGMLAHCVVFQFRMGFSQNNLRRKWVTGTVLFSQTKAADKTLKLLSENRQ